MYYEAKGLPEVTEDQHIKVINNLWDNKIIGGIRWTMIISDFYLINIGKKFFNYYQEVKVRLQQFEPKSKEKTKKIPTELFFDSKKSILHLYGREIRISIKKEQTIGHFVLLHIFERPDEIMYEHSFKDISKETMGEFEEQYNPRKYFRACEDIQEKVLKGTNYEIKDFLIFSSNWVKINEKYLK